MSIRQAELPEQCPECEDPIGDDDKFGRIGHSIVCKSCFDEYMK